MNSLTSKAMRVEEINPNEYLNMIGQLDGLPFEEAMELHGQLTAKYYAYVDLAIQCKKAAAAFQQIARRVPGSAALKAGIKE